ncbi:MULTISPECIES: protealysin inhibitor emfourin [Microbacterium]|uniref:protealysin inhibitor emfourin n=1 Tax=Microbacterium TaxID=33882 RepID=UPI00217E7632|nr:MULTISPECIES: protealysin inhibitor emfourin [Microbacterium]UWF77628.1 hypothetical protein JSY13_00600 [Microbacterium neungamense]WCM55798.1 hypothetical protein JRG78_00615 [Microbacterium sp. EF45047]
MLEYENAAEPDGSDHGDAESAVLIVVVRSGGIAGMRRRWLVRPEPPEADRWVELVRRCPWDEAPGDDPVGADRYVWRIWVRLPDERRETEIPDSRLDGAWRELVEAVREAGRPTPA